MKLQSGYKKLLIGAIVVLAAVISIIVWDKKRMWDYYSDRDSFRTGSGVVTYIRHVEDEKIVLGFSDMRPNFPDNCFVIQGENYRIVMENGILEKLSLGDQVVFVGSFRVFGDGYMLRLIGLTVDGQVLLDSDVGYSCFMDWLRADLLS